MLADVVERVAEGPRVLHDQSQRTKHPAAILKCRQAHAEVGATQLSRSQFDEMDQLPVGGARSAVGQLFWGVNSELQQQTFRVSSELVNEIGKEPQHPGMHDVKSVVGVGNPDRQRSLTHATLLPVSAQRICPNSSS